MRAGLCVVSILALTGAGLTGAAGAAAAADPTAPGARTITVADPRGDVVDRDSADTVRQGRSVDISRAVYRVERGDVTFTADLKRTLLGPHGCRQLMTVTFTSGERDYRATAGARYDLVSRVDDGPWEPVEGSYGGGCGRSGGSTPDTYELSIPRKMFASGAVTDIRTTVRLKGSRARDTVAPTTQTLAVDRRP